MTGKWAKRLVTCGLSILLTLVILGNSYIGAFKVEASSVDDTLADTEQYSETTNEDVKEYDADENAGLYEADKSNIDENAVLYNEDEDGDLSYDGAVRLASGTGDYLKLGVAYHSQAEIKSKIASSGVTLNDAISYNVSPSYTKPYVIGSFSEKSKKTSISMLNLIRYIAGLHDNVVWDEEYGQYAQAAALVNAANDTMSHTPSRPLGMDNEMYKLGRTGAGSSNLGSGYTSINDALVHGWMHDGGNSNIRSIGHRRWVLNPAMSATGFGMAGKYTAMYAFDREGDGDETLVAWPAQQMPLEFFDSDAPWSLSVGESVTSSRVSVKLVRQNDLKTWNFIWNDGDVQSANSSSFINVNNSGYGEPGCIIFRPQGISYASGQQYEVTISGATDQDIRYTVTFFTSGISDGSTVVKANTQNQNNKKSSINKNQKSKTRKTAQIRKQKKVKKAKKKNTKRATRKKRRKAL